MTRPTADQAQALHWYGQYQQALQRAEMLAADLRVLEQALAAANRRLVTATQTLAEHGLPVPPPIRSES